ncbi:hypothetical protein M1589_00685 [Candidatus Marsarchaeota archaeon]|jgi:hypothetical protein|nr:hypothetical protein [Candidatus Marsarchaeota archaeon]MCL5115386.1 hypothetical protein [Candidatus Marsarchaeota archaeon]
MKDNKLLGYIFIALGASTLLFTFYLGYALYTGSLSNAAGSAPASGAGQTVGAGIVGIIGGVLGGPAGTFVYLFIALLVLLVMASIGGRFVKYGIGLLVLYGHSAKEAGSEKAAKAQAKQERKGAD